MAKEVKKKEKVFYLVNHKDYLVEGLTVEQNAECICHAFTYRSLPVFFTKKDAESFRKYGEEIVKIKITKTT